jgi:AcrR family transcriptional regulator
MSSTPIEAPPPTGRRERKKEATRGAIRAAGLDLFERQGYSETTVRHIADAADVAERTFYRYFPSKEDLLLEDARANFEAVEAFVADRPPSESPMASLIKVTQELSSVFAAADDETVKLAEMVNGSTTAQGRLYRMVNEHQDNLAHLFMRRIELGYGDNTYAAYLAAAAGGTAFQQALGRYLYDKSHTTWEFGLEALRMYAVGIDPDAARDIPPLEGNRAEPPVPNPVFGFGRQTPD